MRRRRQELVRKGNIHFTHPVSGEKTAQPEPSLKTKIVSVVSTSLLRGVEAQQDLAKSAPFRNLAEGELVKSCASETADGGSEAVRLERHMCKPDWLLNATL
jgi:hypothetical protein